MRTNYLLLHWAVMNQSMRTNYQSHNSHNTLLTGRQRNHLSFININLTTNMKLTTATIFIAASTSTASISTSGVAASILEHGNSKGSVRTAAKKQGVECAIVDSFAVQKSVDVGVLSCSAGELCVEDPTSTVGGRCKVLASTDDEAAALEPQRERELCTKCTGNSACFGSDQSKIGCGSCLGDFACEHMESDITIGDDSCVGDYACTFSGGELNIAHLDVNKISQ